MSNDVMAATVTPEGKLFGETLKRLREERGLSQEKLANHTRLGAATMTTNYVSDLERGLKVPSLTTILKLAYAMECEPSALLSAFNATTLRRMFR
jgi:transcriptional regulator with XRE-family HTH domain